MEQVGGNVNARWSYGLFRGRALGKEHREKNEGYKPPSIPEDMSVYNIKYLVDESQERSIVIILAKLFIKA